MEHRFYRRRWDELRGDEFDAWGHSVWYFEVDDEGWPVRQIEVYDSGPALRYGAGHEEDQYGGLGQASLDDPEEDWSEYAITRDAFERAWNSAADVAVACGGSDCGTLPIRQASCFHPRSGQPTALDDIPKMV